MFDTIGLSIFHSFPFFVICKIKHKDAKMDGGIPRGDLEHLKQNPKLLTIFYLDPQGGIQGLFMGIESSDGFMLASMMSIYESSRQFFWKMLLLCLWVI
jgi:hypothetical protein